MDHLFYLFDVLAVLLVDEVPGDGDQLLQLRNLGTMLVTTIWTTIISSFCVAFVIIRLLSFHCPYSFSNNLSIYIFIFFYIFIYISMYLSTLSWSLLLWRVDLFLCCCFAMASWSWRHRSVWSSSLTKKRSWDQFGYQARQTRSWDQSSYQARQTRSSSCSPAWKILISLLKKIYI